MPGTGDRYLAALSKVQGKADLSSLVVGEDVTIASGIDWEQPIAVSAGDLVLVLQLAMQRLH